MNVREFVKIVAVVALAMSVSLVVAVMPSQAGQRFWQPCEYEDSVNCVWDARHMGNGEGRSFVSIGDDRGIVKTVFVSHRKAHRLLYR